MTVHGPAAVILVDDALANASVYLDGAALAFVTGNALLVVDGIRTRDAALEGLELSVPDLSHRLRSKALDTAVEALTTTAQE